jgi:predicted Holliday junction resolvase-like endonuclease
MTVMLIILAVSVLVTLIAVTHARGVEKELAEVTERAKKDALESSLFINNLIRRIEVLEAGERIEAKNKEILKDGKEKLDSISTGVAADDFASSVELLHSAAGARSGNRNTKATKT